MKRCGRNWASRLRSAPRNCSTTVFDLVSQQSLHKFYFTRTREPFLVFSALVIWLFLGAYWPRLGEALRPIYAVSERRLASPLLAIPVLLLVLNGLCPYLGIKSRYSFSMFSGLQTEGELWNHYVIPRSVRVFSTMDRLVEIHQSNVHILAQVSEENSRLVYLHFRKIILRELKNDAGTKFNVTYSYEGKRVEVQDARNDPELSHSLPFLQRKLLNYRVVDDPDRTEWRR